MIASIFQEVPLWVWPLLAFLLWYGFRASRTRKTSAFTVYLLPLLGLISINAVVAMPNQQLVWIAYIIAYFLGTIMGYSLQRRWLLEKHGAQVVLAGEWFTMVVLLTIFCMNFANGTIGAIAPEFHANPLFIAAFSFIIGVSSGTFAGRAIKVWRG